MHDQANALINANLKFNSNASLILCGGYDKDEDP
jgi:hypothetical protein